MLGEGLQRVIPMPPVLGGQHPLKSAAELASEAMKSFLTKAQDHSVSTALRAFTININKKNKSFISFPKVLSILIHDLPLNEKSQ